MSKRIHAWETDGCFEVQATVPDNRADEIACTIDGLCRGSYVIEIHEEGGFDHYHYDATTGIGGGCFVETKPQSPNACTDQ
jgi:hypothetical protein